MVQTYVEGKTLEQHLQAGRTFSESEVKELAKSLLEILTYLHQHEPSVIHRDIKPSNILLTNRSGNSAGKGKKQFLYQNQIYRSHQVVKLNSIKILMV